MASINEIFINILEEITPTVKDIALIGNITDKLKKLLDKKANELNIN